MGGHVERELKLRIPDADAFERLRATLAELAPGPVRAVRQVNHFFDTGTGALRRARVVLRLREEAGAWTLGLKGPERAAGGAFAERAEEEVVLAAGNARSLLAGERCPLRELEESAVGSTPLVRSARAHVGAAPLLRLGSFENERTRLGPLALPGDATGALRVVELDRIRFPGERVEHELELELPGDADVGAATAALERVFSGVGIALESVPSKAARFFRILDRRE